MGQVVACQTRQVACQDSDDMLVSSSDVSALCARVCLLFTDGFWKTASCQGSDLAVVVRLGGGVSMTSCACRLCWETTAASDVLALGFLSWHCVSVQLVLHASIPYSTVWSGVHEHAW
jgi:hypothetical protein